MIANQAIKHVKHWHLKHKSMEKEAKQTNKHVKVETKQKQKTKK